MTQPNLPVRPSSERFAVAVVLSTVAALAVGWLAFLIAQAGVAPAILFPIGVGVIVGFFQTAIFRRLNLAPRLVVSVPLGLILGLLTVAIEDYSGYRDHIREFAAKQQSDRLAAMVQATTDQWQPAAFSEYFSALVRRHPVWWSIDVLLTVLSAAAVAGMLGRAKSVTSARRSSDSSDLD